MSEREDQIIAPTEGKQMVCASGKAHGYWSIPYHPLARSYACESEPSRSSDGYGVKCRLMAAERCLVCGGELKDG